MRNINDLMTFSWSKAAAQALALLVLLLVMFVLWGANHRPANTATKPLITNTQHWIWQAKDMALIEHSGGIVIMQGEFSQIGNQVTFIKKGLAAHPIQFQGPVRLLIRAYKLPSVSEFIEQVDYLLQSWEDSGTPIVGIQIDYDSPTAKLDNYRAYLQQVSQHYGREFVSVTGLCSWLSDNLSALNRFGDVVDYVAIQLYQHHLPVPQVEQHIAWLSKLKVRYKVGLTTAPRFSELQFDHSPSYTGKLIFLNTRKLL